MTHEQIDEPDIAPATAPRRDLLRVLAGATIGVVMLVGLAGCGGEGDEEDEEEEEEEDDD